MILDFSNLSVEQQKLLNVVSVEIKDDFNKLTENILNSTRKNISDLVSNILSRNPYQSSLYKICYTLAFVSQLNKKKNINLIITKDYEVFEVLKTCFHSIDINFNGDRNIKQYLKERLKPLIDLARIFIKMKREYLSKDSKRTDLIKQLNPLILIDTFFLKNTIEKRKYVPRYYTGLLSNIDKKTKAYIYYVPEILANYSRKDLKDINNNSEENILYKHDFLKITDYIKIINLLLKHRINKQNKFHFREFDLTNIVIKQSKKTRFNSSSFAAVKNYFFIKRLKTENIELKLVVDWNENQPIDKGLIKGIHDFYSDVKVKGYRGFIISHDYNLYMAPTSYEVENKVIPDEIVVLGKELITETKRFFDKINVSVGPAFRFMSIYEPVKSVTKETNKILIALPIVLNDSIEIIKMLLDANKQHDIAEYHYLIKPHPSVEINKIKKVFDTTLPDNFETVVEGLLKDNLIKSSLFISNASSAILESLAYGIPGIIVAGKNAIVQNPIPTSVNRKIWKLVYTSEGLAEAIDYFMNISEKEREELRLIGNKIKKDFFEKVTKERVSEFLELYEHKQ